MVSFPYEMDAFPALCICWPCSIDIETWIAWCTGQTYPCVLKPAPLRTLAGQASLGHRRRFAKDDSAHSALISMCCETRFQRSSKPNSLASLCSIFHCSRSASDTSASPSWSTVLSNSSQRAKSSCCSLMMISPVRGSKQLLNVAKSTRLNMLHLLYHVLRAQAHIVVIQRYQVLPA